MAKEILTAPEIIPLGNIVSLSEKQWKQNWGDINFSFSFRNRVVEVLSPKIKSTLSEQQLKEIAQNAIKTFLELPGNSIAGYNLQLNENFEQTTYNKKVSMSLGQKVESLGRSNMGSIILLGKGLEDKEYINDLLVDSYSILTESKKKNIRDTIAKLLTKDNFLRQWVKREGLDVQNNFEWNRELARILLRLYSESPSNKLPSLFTQDLSIYPLEVLDEFTEYALGILNNRSKTGKRRNTQRDIMDFKIQLEKLSQGGYFDDSPLSLQVQSKIAGLLKPTQH